MRDTGAIISTHRCEISPENIHNRVLIPTADASDTRLVSCTTFLTAAGEYTDQSMDSIANPYSGFYSTRTPIPQHHIRYLLAALVAKRP
jgi:hypothetical protein